MWVVCASGVLSMVAGGDVRLTVHELDFVAPDFWADKPMPPAPDAGWFQYKGALEWTRYSTNYHLKAHTRAIPPADECLETMVRHAQYATMLKKWGDGSPCSFDNLPSELPTLPRCATMDAMPLVPPDSAVELRFEPCGDRSRDEDAESVLDMSMTVEHHLSKVVRERRRFAIRSTFVCERYKLTKAIYLVVSTSPREPLRQTENEGVVVAL